MKAEGNNTFWIFAAHTREREREKMMKNLFATEKKEDKGRRKICDERN